MKTTGLLAVSTCAFLLFPSCEKQEIKPDKQQAFSSPFKMTTNENVIVRNDQSTLLVTVKNISDNRCSNHLVCEDPGEATVRVEVSNMKNSKIETLLHLGVVNGEPKSTDSVFVVIDSQSYSVHLQDVTPHPVEASEDIKEADLLLERR